MGRVYFQYKVGERFLKIFILEREVLKDSMEIPWSSS